jgi:uncharacterized Rmd1/YagE family protein
MTLNDFLYNCFQDPPMTHEGASFFKLDGTRRGHASMHEFLVEGVRLLEEVARFFQNNSGSTENWIPFIEVEVASSRELRLSNPLDIDGFSDMGQASICIAKDGAVVFWGAWESYQSSANLAALGFPGYRLLFRSEINDRDFEYAWDEYRNRLLLVNCDFL